MQRFVGVSGFVSLLFASPLGCVPKQKRDAEVSYAIGTWWNSAESNLLVGIRQGQSIVVCLRSEGRVEPSTLTRDRTHFEGIVRTALSEWLSALGLRVEIGFVGPACVNDPSLGKIQVVLHYDETYFQARISQTSSPTLGMFIAGQGVLHLNVKGVLNPARDPTRGYKTTLHELGHALGLNHSSAKGSVMQPMLSSASSRLTADDIAGVREIWTRINQQFTRPSLESGPSSRTQQPMQTPASASEAQSIPASSKRDANERPTGTTVAQARLTLRYDSWFKLSTAQSYTLPEREKCSVRVDQKIVVRILDEGALHAGHLRVVLAEDLPGCAFARSGTIGFFYRPHID